jgi:hypothetical protein
MTDYSSPLSPFEFQIQICLIDSEKVRSRSEAHKIMRFEEEAVQLVSKEYDEKKSRVRKIGDVSDEAGSLGIKRARV